jgi:hypothetical protein
MVQQGVVRGAVRKKKKGGGGGASFNKSTTLRAGEWQR